MGLAPARRAEPPDLRLQFGLNSFAETTLDEQGRAQQLYPDLLTYRRAAQGAQPVIEALGARHEQLYGQARHQVALRELVKQVEHD